MLRFGIVGLGSIGRRYADILLRAQVDNARLTAVCDPGPHAGALAQEAGIAGFARAGDLFGSGLVDAVMVTTPARFRAELVQEALAHGLGVIADKPIARHLLEAQRLAPFAACSKAPVAVMFNHRTDPGYQRIKSMLELRELGQLVRIVWYVSHYFRTDAYYRNTPWRGTWAGEGGGVLMNQCHHQLDLLVWMCGLPARVRAVAHRGRGHRIEVEDTVTVYMEMANGCEVSFIASTHDFPRQDRIEMIGTRGSVIKNYKELTVNAFSCDTRELIAGARSPSSKIAPECATSSTRFETNGLQHAGIIQNYVDTWRGAASLTATWREGTDALHLANAILYSSLTDQWVDLPLDAHAYAQALAELSAQASLAPAPIKR